MTARGSTVVPVEGDGLPHPSPSAAPGAMSAPSGTMNSVVAETGPDAGERRGHVVGRQQQRAQLTRLLDEVRASGSRFVLVGGDAGAGKTTVVQAFLSEVATAAGVAGVPGGPHAGLVRTIRGQCVPLGGDGLPYAPVVGALRDLVQLFGRDRVLDWAGAGAGSLGVLLPELGGQGTEGDTIRLQLFEAVARLLERASEDGPLVLVMEDIHWADESTRHLLRFLTRALTDASVLMVATFRTDELTRRHPLRPFLAEVGRLPRTARLDVPALTRDEVAELLTRLLGHPPSRVAADLVFRRSEGIPYFVEELSSSTATGCIDMPDTLRDALNVRVLALSDQAQQVLQLASVAGNRVDHDLLEAVSSEPPSSLDAALREAIDAAVLTADERGYAFRHALLRDVVHDDLLPGQHARLHARYAAVLEARPGLVGADSHAMEVAHHWNAAHEAAKAFRWSLEAARSASAAYPEMLKLYERALELWDQVDDPEQLAGSRSSLLVRAARAAEDAGEDERALALASAALDDLDPARVEERVELLVIKTRLLAALMRPGTVETMREAYEVLPASADPVRRARVLEELARRTLLSGAVADALVRAEQAVEAAQTPATRRLECNARITLGTVLVNLARESEGLEQFRQAGALTKLNTRTQLRYFVNYSDALHLAGRYRAAVDEAMTGVAVAGQLGLERTSGSMLAGNAAEPLLALGEWTRAAGIIDRALELDPPLHHRTHLRLLRAWLMVWRGKAEEADALLIDVRPMIHGLQASPQYASQAIRVDIDHALAVGDAARAWSDATAFFDHWDTFQAAHCYPVLAGAAAAARRLDRTHGAARSARVRELAEGAARVAVRQHWAPVVAAELSDTRGSWSEALEALADAPGPAHLPPYAGLRLGLCLVAARDRGDARRVLAAAMEQALALGSTLLTDRLADLAQRAGFTGAGLQRPRSAEPSPVAALTAREREVLGLVAAGRSNGEIGAALFISTKTASVHVSNILAKLGVRGRGEAAAIAHRAGLA